jgi:hypothetical protein
MLENFIQGNVAPYKAEIARLLTELDRASVRADEDAAEIERLKEELRKAEEARDRLVREMRLNY